MSNNLQVWEAVQATDPKYTRQYKNDGGGTSINAIYMIKKATELFGPLGTGWGYDIVEERFDTGGPIAEVDGQVVYAQMHSLKVQLWYMSEGKKATVTHFGHTPFVTKNKYGVSTDMEAPKKSLTDAIKKCLSMLGFSADIFMGEFDDPTYLEKRAQDAEVERAENQVEAKTKQEMEYKQSVEKAIKLMGEATQMNMLEGIFKDAIRKATIRKNEKAQLQLTKAKDKRKKELEALDEAV